MTFSLHYAYGPLRRAGVDGAGISLVGGASRSDEAAMQARWVVDGEPPIVTSDGGWEPRRVPALDDARERVARLRQRALEEAR